MVPKCYHRLTKKEIYFIKATKSFEFFKKYHKLFYYGLALRADLNTRFLFTVSGGCRKEVNDKHIDL